MCVNDVFYLSSGLVTIDINLKSLQPNSHTWYAT